MYMRIHHPRGQRIIHCFPKTKNRISMFLRFRNPTFRKHKQLICIGASWHCVLKLQSINRKLQALLELDQSVFVCISSPTFNWKWWNIWMLTGVNIYEHISRKSGTCIYLMCWETQLTKMIIIRASQCYSGRVNKLR